MKKLKASDIQLITGGSVKVYKGIYTIGKAYYYRNVDLTEWWISIEDKLNKSNLDFKRVDWGDTFKEFRGGDNVWQGSHFWYQFKLLG